MSHPNAKQSAASTAARLKRIGGKGASAGKAWGSTAMASKTATSYPSKNAGSQVPFFAEGGSVGSRPDRLARGGSAKKKHKGSGHTNVVVQVPPPAAPEKIPTPVPVPKPVPVPVPAGGPPPRPPGPPGAPAGGPPMLPPGLGAGGPPGIPPGAMPLRKRGGTVGFKSGGSVKDDDAEEDGETEAEEKKEEKADAKQKGNPGEMLKSGGSVKQGGGGSAQANEPGGYPVMKNGGGGGLGRLEKAKKKTA